MGDSSIPIMQSVKLDTNEELGFQWWSVWAWLGLIGGNIYIVVQTEHSTGLMLGLIALNTALMILILRYNKYAFLIATVLSINPLLWIINGIYLKNRWNHPKVNTPNNAIDKETIERGNETTSSTTFLTAITVDQFNTHYKTDLKLADPELYIAIRLVHEKKVFCLIPKDSLEVLKIDGLSPIVRLVDDELVSKFDSNDYLNGALMLVSKKVKSEPDIVSLWSVVNQLHDKENAKIKINNFSGFIFGVIVTLILYSYNYQGYSSSYFSFEYSLPMTIFDDWFDMYSETAEKFTIVSMALMMFLSWTFRENLGSLISGFVQGFVKKL